MWQCATCGHFHEAPAPSCWVCGTAIPPEVAEFIEPPPFVHTGDIVPPSTPLAPDDELPAWLAGVKYTADVDTIAMRAIAAGAVVELLATPEQIEHLIELLTKCLDRSRQQRNLIDVPG